VLDFPGSSFPNHVEGREAITIAAFWPKGTPCTDFSQCDAVVARLATYATPEALARLEQLT
jgi:hypothetical protein